MMFGPRLSALGLEVPSARSLDRHLHSHLDAAVVGEDEHEDAKPAPMEAATHVREFVELWKLYERQARRLKRLDDAIVLASDPEGEAHRANQIVALSAGMRQTLEAIARIRATDSWPEVLARMSVGVMLKHAMDAVFEQLRGLLRVCEATPGCLPAADAIRALAEGDAIGRSMSLAARTSYLFTCAEWKIEPRHENDLMAEDQRSAAR
jgi:hypothetical protein